MECSMSGESRHHQTTYFPAKSYLLNQSNCFIWFSPEWNLEFENAFPYPYDAGAYLGRSFFDVLGDPGTRHIYEALFKRIRKPGSRPLSLTMRCDQFPFKILLSQELRTTEDGHIRVEIDYVRLEKQNEQTPSLLLEQTQALKMCSWCQSILDRNDSVWHPLEQALGFFPLLHDPELPAITHGCCPSCLKNLRGQSHEYSRS